MVAVLGCALRHLGPLAALLFSCTGRAWRFERSFESSRAGEFLLHPSVLPLPAVNPAAPAPPRAPQAASLLAAASTPAHHDDSSSDRTNGTSGIPIHPVTAPRPPRRRGSKASSFCAPLPPTVLSHFGLDLPDPAARSSLPETVLEAESPLLPE